MNKKIALSKALPKLNSGSGACPFLNLNAKTAFRLNKKFYPNTI